MDESRRIDVSTANAKNMNSTPDEDFGNDFLSSWKLPKSGKDTVLFSPCSVLKSSNLDSLPNDNHGEHPKEIDLTKTAVNTPSQNSQNEVVEESVSLKKFLKKTSAGTKTTEEGTSGHKSLSSTQRIATRSAKSKYGNKSVQPSGTKGSPVTTSKILNSALPCPAMTLKDMDIQSEQVELGEVSPEGTSIAALERTLEHWVRSGTSTLEVKNGYDFDGEQLMNSNSNGGYKVYLVKLQPLKCTKANVEYVRRSHGGRWRKGGGKGKKITTTIRTTYSFYKNNVKLDNLKLEEYALESGPKDMVICKLIWGKSSTTSIKEGTDCLKEEPRPKPSVDCFRKSIHEHAMGVSNKAKEFTELLERSRRSSAVPLSASSFSFEVASNGLSEKSIGMPNLRPQSSLLAGSPNMLPESTFSNTLPEKSIGMPNLTHQSSPIPNSPNTLPKKNFGTPNIIPQSHRSPSPLFTSAQSKFKKTTASKMVAKKPLWRC